MDLLLLQFYLGGADFKDVYYLKKEQLTRNRIFFFRQKNTELAFEIHVLISGKAEAILQKYRDHDTEYLFPWRKDEKGHETAIQNTRRALKKVQEKLKIKLQPKDEPLTTKVSRHTFASLGKFARIPEDMLREIMGHERTETDTIYKTKYRTEERDAAQLKIIGEKEAFERKTGLRKIEVVRKAKRK